MAMKNERNQIQDVQRQHRIFQRKYMYKILHLLFLLFLMPLSSVAQAQDSIFKDTIGLEEVVVNQKFIRHEIGKYVVDVLSLRKGKTDLVNLIEQIPGLMVVDNKISIQGKGRVKVMFNGRLKNIPESELYSLLKSRPAYNVTKVEVIKEPGAKYDAEGNYGILNFITERRIDYVGGDVGDEVVYRKKWTKTLRSSLNYSKGKVDANFSTGWTYGKIDYTETNITQFLNLARHSSTYYVPRQNDYNLSGVMDFHLDSMSVFSFSISYMNIYKKNIGENTLNSNDLTNNMIDSGSSYSFTRTPRENITSSFYIDRQWNSTDKISFLTDVFRYDFHNYYDFLSNIRRYDGVEIDDKFLNKGRSLLNGFSSALDIEKQLPWDIQLSVGGKVTISTTTNTSIYDITTIPQQNDAFKYTENINAGYLTLDKKVRNSEFVLGVRYEQTKTKAISNNENYNKKSYGKFFPDVRLSYNFNNGSSLALSINSSIDRPGIRNLNPFKYYVSRYGIAVGNPELRPSTWWNIRLRSNIEFNGGELNSELTYARLSNIFDQTITMDTISNVSTTQWNNAMEEKVFSFETSLYYYKLKWLKITAIASYELSKTTSNQVFLIGSQKGFGQFYFTNLRFIFNKQQNFTGFMQASYNGSERTINGRIDGSFNMSCGINYSCLKNHLQLRFAVNNILSSKISGYTRSNDGMYMSFRNNYRPLTFNFALSYNFGKRINVKSKSYEEIKSRFD